MLHFPNPFTGIILAFFFEIACQMASGSNALCNLQHCLAHCMPSFKETAQPNTFAANMKIYFFTFHSQRPISFSPLQLPHFQQCHQSTWSWLTACNYQYKPERSSCERYSATGSIWLCRMSHLPWLQQLQTVPWKASKWLSGFETTFPLLVSPHPVSWFHRALILTTLYSPSWSAQQQ